MTVRDRLRSGLVIPAHPLALTRERKLDEKRQRALTRYYLAAGAGGIAVGVHTTQFTIRDPKINLLKPVLKLAAEEIGTKAVKIAGVCGTREQALAEAHLASDLGYDAALLSMAALKNEEISALVEHTRTIASVIPIIGLYLQPAVGGRVLPFEFWRQFVEIENVVAIKIAPFNRYQTIDVVRAVAQAGRGGEIALYTGNDDNILPDLITDFDLTAHSQAHAGHGYSNGNGAAPVRIVGGLLGQWAVWTEQVVQMLTAIQQQRAAAALDYRHWLTYGAQMT